MHIRSCGAIPYIEDGQTRFLVVKHRKGHWGFPKGRQEPGETDEETALREVFEETGIRVELSRPQLKMSYSTDTGIEKTVILFLGKAEKAKVSLNDPDGDIVDCEWLELDQVFERLTYKSSKVILKIAAKELGLSENTNSAKNLKTSTSG